MRMSKLIGKTVKESPRDAELPSHKFMLRAGYMRQYSAGIYGLLPLATISVAKIEKICREEMNAIGGQEVRMPCTATKELWDEAGRYQTFGKDMIRFQDRNEKQMVLNPTHEELVVYLARTEITSYRQLPLMLFQIQSKFRDEPRPRGGLVRLREFTMKDAYSFHMTEEDLKEFYDRAHAAYIRFYNRTGCKNFISVMSDNGVFGGKYSHEFQMLVPTGEDKLISCLHCKTSSNEEIATTPFIIKKSKLEKLEKVHTPNQKTIDSLCNFLQITPGQTAKAVIFQTLSGTPVVSFVRGDLDVISAKIRNLVKSEVVPATYENLVKAGAVAGSTGPIGLNLHNCYVVLDHTVVKSTNLVTGANEKDYHFTNFNAERDFLSTVKEFEKEKVIIGDIAAARSGDPCSVCENPLQETRGIEIGNIFHLGTKYTKEMECTFLDQNGKKQYPVMGCYGIGITRLLPAIIEESHDDRGPILPLPIAPYEIHLCSLNRKEENVNEESEKLYKTLTSLGYEVLFDDRDEKPGSQFADADLIGIPYRLIVSPKTLAENCVELKYRDNRMEPRKVKLTEIIDILKAEIAAEYRNYNNV